MANEFPVNEQTLEELNSKLKELDEADILIEKSVRAGIDMDAQKVQTRELRDRLNRMKQAFFPGR